MCCVWSFNCCYKKKLSGWIKQGLSRFSWKHLKTHFPCHCISFFFFSYVFNPECHTSVLLVIGFFPFLCPPLTMGIEEGRNWGEKCTGKNPQLLLWRNLTDLTFTSRTWCFCSSCSVCPCIFLLFSFPVGVFLLFLVQQTSM